jgi:hypothetical protein
MPWTRTPRTRTPRAGQAAVTWLDRAFVTWLDRAFGHRPVL